MGPLTQSMKRLCNDIVAQRGARLQFVQDLKQEVTTWKADFRQAYGEMARQGQAERQGFVKALGREVAGLRSGFRQAHQDMARQTKAERRAALTHLKKTVANFKGQWAADLAGAHLAWCGPSPAQRRAKAEAEHRAKAEAEQRLQEQAEQERLRAAARVKEEDATPRAEHEPKGGAGRPGKKKA